MFDSEFHWESDFNLIAFLPSTCNLYVAGRSLGGTDVLFLPIYLDAIADTCPEGVTDCNGIFTSFVNRQFGTFLVWEFGGLCQRIHLVLQFAGREEVDIQCLAGIVVGIDEVSVFTVVLHTGTYTTPHTFVHLRIDFVALWTQGGEIDIATCLRVLGREDVVVHRILVEVSIASRVCVIKQVLCQFQHIVCVTGLWTIQIAHIAVAAVLVQEVFVHRVTTDADRSVAHYILPEVLGSRLVGGRCGIELGNALESDVLRYLSVGMTVVQERRVERLHAVHHFRMAVFLGRRQVFLVAKQLVGISDGFVHASVLVAQHVLHISR